MAPEITPENAPDVKLLAFRPDITMLEAALIYAAHGWPIFPCQPINKTPYPGTHGFKDATTDPVRIRRWWSRVPDSMIGVALGARSGIFAVDLDRKPGQPDGVATWAKLTAEHGPAPTLSSTTPSTGQHHFFHHCCDLRNVELNSVAPGIEIKAEGGYVILPPSFCTDPKFNNGAGAGYRWNAPLIAPAEPPDWLVAEIICHNNPTYDHRPPTEERSVSYEHIKAALGAIDPDVDRATWFQIGCALFSQLGSEGFALWNGWSSRGQKYKQREMDQQWASIVKAKYPYTIGTLFYYANKAQPDWARAEPNQPGHVDDGAHHARQEWPTMDDAAFHGFAGEVVNTIAPHSESDPVALLIQLLTCVGNIFNRTRYYPTESGRQQANLFIALVGTSAKTRKGTSFGRIQAVIDAANPYWTDKCIQGGLSSGEGLIHVVRDPIMKWDKKEEELIEIDPGVLDKRLLILEPEFAGVLAVMERAGNTISHLIRKAWDGSKLQTMTRKEPLTATGAHISIIGHITQDELRARLTHTEMANGFANRFLFVLIKRAQVLPFGGNLSDSQIRELGEELQKIIIAVEGDKLNNSAPPERLTMTEAARERWSQIYSDLSAERPGLLGAITARGETQTLRLALIYALLDRANEIDLPHLEAGLAVWNYCDASAVHIFGDTLGDEVADTILRALKNAGREGMSRSLINDLFGGHRSTGRINAALGLLSEKGCARTELRGTRGRPIEMWFYKTG